MIFDHVVFSCLETHLQKVRYEAVRIHALVALMLNPSRLALEATYHHLTL